ncbi:MAG TPA: DUF885 family protein, partial [Thermoanaerobaculia bacterium]|nr:DUF885 family protein [Thermoanaerobaculia bacterium]
MRRKLVVIASCAHALFALVALEGRAASAPAADLDTRRKALRDLLAEQWEHTLQTSPEFASSLGDRRWNDQLSEVSPAAIEREIASTRAFLARFEAIDTSGFPEQEALDKTLMVRDLRLTLDTVRFEGWLMPLNQVGGIHLYSIELATTGPFETVKDYDDYVARLRALPRQFDGTIERLRAGMAKGLMPPKVVLERVPAQAREVADAKPEESPFAAPLASFPEAVPAAERPRLRAAVLAAIREAVAPAYVRFADFVAKEYLPRGRNDVGLWALPDGEARYAMVAASSTSTAMTPDEIHQLGRREVARIEEEMKAVARRLGYADLKSLDAAIAADPKLHAQTAERLLDLYRGYTAGMQAKLPELFGRLPKAALEVKPMETTRSPSAPPAGYTPGSPDGKRPARIEVNVFEPEKRTTLNAETTCYHEGIPGHHLQIALAQELPTLPPFRQNAYYTAYTEGWAHYAESLAREAGFYADPYSLYGHLQRQM